MEKKRLRNILIILFVLALLIVGFWYGSAYFKEKRNAKEDLETIQNRQAIGEMEIPEESEQVQEIAQSEVKDTIERRITAVHTVKEGESFSLITGFYWDDIYLWPDLYIRNSMRTDDPDLIYPDEIITIYNRLGRGDQYSTQEASEISKAYLEVYRIYKKLGDSKNNSIWSLLWCAARYDKDFLETYKDSIDPDDRAMAQKYIDEEGFLD